MNWNEAKEILGSRSRRKLEYATYLEDRGDYIAIKQHGNTIAYIEEGFTSYTNAGYYSRTTKDRLNRYSNQIINQRNWDWLLNGDDYESNYWHNGVFSFKEDENGNLIK